MDKPRVYEISVEGRLAESWSDWFEGLTICHNQQGQTNLRGSLPDQAALHGVLSKIYNLNLVLISVRAAEER